MRDNRGAEPEDVDASSDSHIAYPGDDMAAPSKRTLSPAFQFYPKDFLTSSKVQRMTLTEVGAYTVLLSFCWLDHGLPTDVNELARIVKVPARQFAKMWRGPLSECFYEKGGKLQNTRLDIERKKQADYRKQQKEKADKRWQSQGNATAQPRQYQSDALLSPVSNLQSPTPVQTRTPRPSTLIQRRRLDAAYEGGRTHVPQRMHNDFVRLRGGNDSELFAWYEVIDSTYGGEIDPDMFAFWRARYREKWPPAPERSKGPAWLTEAV